MLMRLIHDAHPAFRYLADHLVLELVDYLGDRGHRTDGNAGLRGLQVNIRRSA
jgi:hypothetical protein